MKDYPIIHTYVIVNVFLANKTFTVFA